MNSSSNIHTTKGYALRIKLTLIGTKKISNVFNGLQEIAAHFSYSHNIHISLDNAELPIYHFHKSFTVLRSKWTVSHLTEINNARDLSFKELHSFIDDIEDIMKKYYRLFGTAIIFDNLKTPNFYFNFSLNLR